MGDNKTIKMIISGDTHPGGGRVRELAANNRVDELFGDFLPLLRESEFSITNLESPVLDEEGTPIPKTGPHLKSTSDTLSVLKSAGFQLVTLANNHIMDYGDEGLFSTLNACEEAGIETVGAGKNLEAASRTFYHEINDLTVAVINIAENEFGTTGGDEPGAHPLNPIQNFYVIREAAEKADKVIVIVHGGHEMYVLPSPRMKETYRFFADAGADLVAGHHTHCYSGYERYNQTPIFYSLGNFLFDNRQAGKKTIWNEGILLELAIQKDGIEYKLHPYVQNEAKAGLRKLTDAEKKEFDDKIDEYNKLIQNDAELKNKFDEYCIKSGRLYLSYIEPHSIGILHALRNRNLIPSLLSNRKKRLLLNLSRCEAHRDVLIKTLTQ